MKIFSLLFSLMIPTLIFAQVGINTETPQSTLDINGNLSVKHVSLTGSASATPIDDGVYISISPTSNDEDFELPDPRDYPGRVYIIRNVSDAINADITLEASVITDGVRFFPGDSTTGITQVDMDTAIGTGNVTKTLIFISDGANWTYGALGF